MNTTSIPEHPELYYRLTNEWKGWHDFLGPQSEDSLEQDNIESQAFEILKKNPKYNGEYNDIIINLWKQLIE